MNKAVCDTLLERIRNVNSKDIDIVYIKERHSWNVFIGSEWYCEGTYEECSKIFESLIELEEDGD